MFRSHQRLRTTPAAAVGCCLPLLVQGGTGTLFGLDGAEYEHSAGKVQKDSSFSSSPTFFCGGRFINNLGILLSWLDGVGGKKLVENRFEAYGRPVRLLGTGRRRRGQN